MKWSVSEKGAGLMEDNIFHVTMNNAGGRVKIGILDGKRDL